MSKQPYNGPEKRAPLPNGIDTNTQNTIRIAELEVRHELVLQSLSQGSQRMDKLTETLEKTNESLNRVCLQLAEQKGARKMGLAIATAIGSFGGFLGELGLDKMFHGK